MDALQVGRFRITPVSGGRFKLDGGAMFGIVPKPLWSRVAPADERNRIDLATNCFLVECNEARLIIDTGYGLKLSDKERDIYAVRDEGGLVANLQKYGLAPESIDFVVLSHLHFDHAGGCTTRLEDGSLVPTFRHALYIVQRLEWEIASSGKPEWEGMFPPENFQVLEETGRIQRVDDGAEIVPGIRVQRTGGHTPGHQIIRIQDGDAGAVFLGDLCPTWNHLHRSWCMAYDSHVVDVRRLKPIVLEELVDRRWWALSDHDPHCPAVMLKRDSKRHFAIAEKAFVS